MTSSDYLLESESL